MTVKSITGLKEFNEKVRQSTKLAFVVFWRKTCVPCRRFSPTFADVAARHAADAEFFSVNTGLDENDGVKQEHDIDETPTVIAYWRGTIVGECEDMRSASAFEKKFVAGIIARMHRELTKEAKKAEKKS